MRSLLELEQLIFKEGVARDSITFNFWVYFVNYRLVVVACIFLFNNDSGGHILFCSSAQIQMKSRCNIYICHLMCLYSVSFFILYPLSMHKLSNDDP